MIDIAEHVLPRPGHPLIADQIAAWLPGADLRETMQHRSMRVVLATIFPIVSGVGAHDLRECLNVARGGE